MIALQGLEMEEKLLQKTKEIWLHCEDFSIDF